MRKLILVTAVLGVPFGCERVADTQPTTSTSPSSTSSPATSPEAADEAPPDDTDQGANTVADPQTNATARAPAKPTLAATAVEIVFEDIQLPIQADVVFRPFMLTDRVKELDGKRIRINGYMLPDSRTKGITQFVLLKNNQCKFGPGGQADHLLNVLMVDGVTAKFRDKPITVEGVLKVNPFQGPDGNTWSIYDLACERVETYRPRR